MQTTRGASLSDAENPDDGGASPVAGRPRRITIAVLAAVAIVVLVLDVVSKIIVVAKLTDHAPVKLLGGFTTLQLTRNSGAAFSIGTSMTFVFTAIAAGVVVVIARYSRKLRSVPWAVACGLLLGGALGNLMDRIFREPGLFRGHVVDWIEWPHWPIFNLADSAIVCGGILAVLLSSLGYEFNGTRHGPTPPADDSAEASGDEPGSDDGVAGGASAGAVAERDGGRGDEG